jgi:glycosyltransferase involved in cell wall biosynthesis
MKLLVFAHVPPPHHGQSYMVKLMLDGFGGDRREKSAGAKPGGFGIECYHVNARFSKTIEDIGEFQGWKILLIFFYCLQAIWCRFRYGVDNFYYVPAPGKKVALYRDWLVMFVCRRFFKRTILHWHAAGLAKWLETSMQFRARAMTYRLFRPVDLSIVLSRYNVADAEKLLSRRVIVVNNGIADPCPDFTETILPLRRARFEARAKLLAGEQPAPAETEGAGGNPRMIKVLFLAHCTREKGLFDAMEGVVAANRQLAARQSPARMKLHVAGSFTTADEKNEFDRMMQKPEFASAVKHFGFVSGDEKCRLLREADLFCFPTHYLGENQPVNLIEAMAFGLPIVTTRWRSLPEILPPDYPGLVDTQSPAQIAGLLLRVAAMDLAVPLRETFLRRFTIEQHLAGMAAAIRSVEDSSSSSSS